MSITNRVKKNVQNQPPEFELGSLITQLRNGKEYTDFAKSPASKNLKAVNAFMFAAKVERFGLLIDDVSGGVDFYTPCTDLNRNAELLAIQIKTLVQGLNVSVDKVLGKVMASIYESEKEESQ